MSYTLSMAKEQFDAGSHETPDEQRSFDEEECFQELKNRINAFREERNIIGSFDDLDDTTLNDLVVSLADLSPDSLDLIEIMIEDEDGEDGGPSFVREPRVQPPNSGLGAIALIEPSI